MKKLDKKEGMRQQNQKTVSLAKIKIADCSSLEESMCGSLSPLKSSTAHINEPVIIYHGL